MERDRTLANRLARESLARNDATGWFESLYAAAQNGQSVVPWADMSANPNLLAWLESTGTIGGGRKTLVVGCGLGDDAEELARRGFDVTAFDISPTAVAWCRGRFPDSRVQYVAADLLSPPPNWREAFDFVFEAYTLQVLPPTLHGQALERLAKLVAPGGTLLVICRARDDDTPAGDLRWPLARKELAALVAHGLSEVRFEDYWDQEDPPVRRFRGEYRRLTVCAA